MIINTNKYWQMVGWGLTGFLYGMAVIIIFRNSSISYWFRDVLPIGLRGFELLMISGSIGLSLYLLFAATLRKRWRIDRKLFSAILYSSIGLIIIERTLVAVESAKYENFFFGNYGLFLPSLKVFSKVMWILLVSSLIYSWRQPNSWLSSYGIQLFQKAKLLKRYNSLGTELRSVCMLGSLLVGGSLVVGVNLVGFVSWLTAESDLVITNIQVSYEDRYEKGLIELHRDIKFISTHTPSDAVVRHPPQSVPFPITGNQVIIRYHLFPRILVSDAMYKQFAWQAPPDQKLYSIIDIGIEDGQEVVFPNEVLMADEVLLLLEDGDVLRYTNQIVTPDWVRNHDTISIGYLLHSI